MIASKSEEISIVVIEQGRTAETALNPTNGMIDSKTKTSVNSRCTLAQGVEMVVEQSHIG
jgi:hypothetical protein